MFSLTEVSKTYKQGGTTIRAVDKVDLHIEMGEFLVIQGSSGSGKTTLLQLLGGLDRPSSGKIEFEGKDLTSLGDGGLTDLRLTTFGFVFQQFNLIPTLTAFENVEIALAPTDLSTVARRARVTEVLGAVGLGDRAAHLPSQLSGGEQQRVAIARALANRPRVILADEPTGNLDSKTGREIVELLSNVSSEQGQSVILVTHDQSIAAVASRVLLMQDGEIVRTPEPMPEQEPLAEKPARARKPSTRKKKLPEQ